MNTITIIQGSIFISYVGFLMILFKGPLPSISDSTYRLEGLWNSLFTWFCWSIGFLMFFQTDGTTPLLFISGAGICFTGTARYFKASDKITGTLHYIGAVVCIISALLAIALERHNIIPLTAFVLSAGIMEFLYIKNRIWWIEIAAFVTIIIGLLKF